MDVSSSVRKKTRVSVPTRRASLKPLRWWAAGSLILVGDCARAVGSPDALVWGVRIGAAMLPANDCSPKSR